MKYAEIFFAGRLTWRRSAAKEIARSLFSARPRFFLPAPTFVVRFSRRLRFAAAAGVAAPARSTELGQDPTPCLVSIHDTPTLINPLGFPVPGKQDLADDR